MVNEFFNPDLLGRMHIIDIVLEFKLFKIKTVSMQKTFQTIAIYSKGLKEKAWMPVLISFTSYIAQCTNKSKKYMHTKASKDELLFYLA